MLAADGPFAFATGTLTIGAGEHRIEIPAERASLTFERGDAPWPVPTGRLFAGDLHVEGTLTARPDPLDPWAGFRDMRCPGCDTAWADLEPGHSWSSAKEHCWTAAGPIDEYGRPIEGGDDD